MKKMFNIKSFYLYLFALLCMFLATSNVKADNDMSNITDKIKEEYGLVSCTYVEYGTNNVIAELVFNSSDFTLVNRVDFNGNSDFIKKIKSAKFSPQFKLSDLNGKCPSLLFLGEMDENLVVKASLENFSGATMKLGYKTTMDDIKDIITNASNGGYNPDDYVVCEYAKDNADSVILNLIISPDKVSLINKIDGQGLSVYKKFENITFEPNFSVSNLNKKCPNTLYLGVPDNVSVSKVNLEQKSTTDMKVGRVVKLNNITNNATNKEVQDAICDGKTVEIITTIFNLIRFLVPIIIIILSVINFVGVVISGENEKMEKAKKNFVIRLVIGFAILIVPAILEVILKLAGLIETDLAEVTCKLFN